MNHLHPNPGWPKHDFRHFQGSMAPNHSDLMVGKHCILELYDCDQNKLNDEAFIRTTITTSTKVAGATLIHLITHQFTPCGITGLALLAESHISIHTWPEINYAAIDVFTCGRHTKPEKACDFFVKEFAADNYLLKSLKRKTPSGISNSLRDPNS